MFRGEMSAYSESPRSRRKTPWVPLMVVVLAGLVVAHVAGLTKPLATMALQLSGYGRTPGSRLIGDWESNDDPMFRRVCYLRPKKDWDGAGFYMADSGRGMREVIFKVTAEDHSGRHVTMSEFLPGVNENYRVRYSIADDGRSMTREYDDRNGKRVSCQYRYLGPPTQSAP